MHAYTINLQEESLSLFKNTEIQGHPFIQRCAYLWVHSKYALCCLACLLGWVSELKILATDHEGSSAVLSSAPQTQMSFICSPLRYLTSSRSLPEAAALDPGCHMIVCCSASSERARSLCPWPLQWLWSGWGQARRWFVYKSCIGSDELTWIVPYGLTLSWLSVLSRRGLGRECHGGRSYANSLCFVLIFVLVEVMPLTTLGIWILATFYAWLGCWDYVHYTPFLWPLFLLLLSYC